MQTTQKLEVRIKLTEEEQDTLLKAHSIIDKMTDICAEMGNLDDLLIQFDILDDEEEMLTVEELEITAFALKNIGYSDEYLMIKTKE